MDFFEELKWRGLIHSYTDDKLIEELNHGRLTFYLGVDPTGNSLHVGHLVVYLLAKRLEMHGHHPILLIGGSTSSVGDPKIGGERQLLTRETINKNAECLKKQVLKLFDCEIVNNYDWTHKIDVLTFLREYGKHFNVNYLIHKETVKARLDSGISYTEFSYQILQALDFEHLYRTMNCQMQIGGQDQWGNITGGLELIRKLNGPDSVAYGLTTPLVTKSDGTKFGKTENDSVWLDPEQTTPYAFYQYWYNTADADVVGRLKQFTFLTYQEIEELAAAVQAQPHLRAAQKRLADELTKLIHGQAAWEQAVRVSEALFSGDVAELSDAELKMGFAGVPSVALNHDVDLITALTLTGAARSKREAREFIANGAISLNGTVCRDLAKVLTKADQIGAGYLAIRRGKKNYFLLEYK